MATQINTPIPQNPIGENFAWRDWFQKLSNKVYGSMANQDSGSVVIIGGTINGTSIGSATPSTGKFTTLDATTTRTSSLLVDSGTNGQILVGRTSDHAFLPATLGSGTGIGITSGAGSLSIANTGVTSIVAGTGISVSGATGAVTVSAIAKYYGSFFDTTTQTAAANTATAITFNNTDLSSGVALGSPTSRIVISNAGIYNVQFSIQGANTASAADNITVWFKVNGSDLTNTAGISAVPAKHGSISGALVFGWNQLLSFSANDYLEMYWATDGGTSSLVYYAAGTGPTHPASPSVAVSVTQI